MCLSASSQMTYLASTVMTASALSTGSYSATVERVHEVLVDCSIDDSGYMNFETDERLGLVYDMDEEGRLVVYYLEED